MRKIMKRKWIIIIIPFLLIMFGCASGITSTKKNDFVSREQGDYKTIKRGESVSIYNNNNEKITVKFFSKCPSCTVQISADEKIATSFRPLEGGEINYCGISIKLSHENGEDIIQIRGEKK